MDIIIAQIFMTYNAVYIFLLLAQTLVQNCVYKRYCIVVICIATIDKPKRKVSNQSEHFPFFTHYVFYPLLFFVSFRF